MAWHWALLFFVCLSKNPQWTLFRFQRKGESISICLTLTNAKTADGGSGCPPNHKGPPVSYEIMTAIWEMKCIKQNKQMARKVTRGGVKAL